MYHVAVPVVKKDLCLFNILRIAYSAVLLSHRITADVGSVGVDLWFWWASLYMDRPLIRRSNLDLMGFYNFLVLIERNNRGSQMVMVFWGVWVDNDVRGGLVV